MIIIIIIIITFCYLKLNYTNLKNKIFKSKVIKFTSFGIMTVRKLPVVWGHLYKADRQWP
jgi:hypothetical protein